MSLLISARYTVVAILLLTAAPAAAYVGPGAGFAFVGSFLSLLAAFVIGAASLLIFPFRIARRVLGRTQGYKKAKVKKIVFLGLDGLEPDLVERYLGEGKLPNLAKLKEQGRYSRLRTTFPPLSPVAWATFATGSNPGKHNLFDFLNRSLRSYMPELSSSQVNQPTRVLKLGQWRIPLRKPTVEMRRKSRTFWSILGENQVSSTILRVPITFPPEKFEGRLLSAMCTPDLLGTQGSFQEFTTREERVEFAEAGERRRLSRDGDAYVGEIRGPRNSFREDAGDMRLPFRLQLKGCHGCGILSIDGKKYELEPGKNTPWVRLAFKAGLGVTVSGIGQFRLVSTEPDVSLYLTPIAIDPEKPALPVSYPSYYAPYLAKLLGDYSTLGLAEDTWALNERVIDEDAFLEQAYWICDEREAMFFSSLERTRKGVVACVFDTPDRVQHMFYRYLEPDHPAHKTNDNGLDRYAGEVERLYARMDSIVGKTLDSIDRETVLFVLSDHGFKSFQRGININSWLEREGYLTVKDGCAGAGYLRGVDWSRTRAYSFGLAGIYLNLKGREARGIVEKADGDALTEEIAAKITGLIDEERGTTAVRKGYPKKHIYAGPYLSAAPDVVVGYNIGYRSSWDTALGKVGGSIFEDNVKAWSGDHCIDPPIIPGVLFCNRGFEAENPGIEDMAPTALSLFGYRPPRQMDGVDVGVRV